MAKCDAWSLHGEVEIYIGSRGSEPCEKFLTVAEARTFIQKLQAAADKAEKELTDATRDHVGATAEDSPESARDGLGPTERGDGPVQD